MKTVLLLRFMFFLSTVSGFTTTTIATTSHSQKKVTTAIIVLASPTDNDNKIGIDNGIDSRRQFLSKTLVTVASSSIASTTGLGVLSPLPAKAETAAEANARMILLRRKRRKMRQRAR